MTISAAIVLFLVVWFMCLFVVLPLRIQSQDEAGEVVPGTPKSAPADPQLKRKAVWATIATVVIWVPLCAVIISGVITVEDIDFFNRMNSN